MNIFAPLITKLEPSRRAFVRMPFTSDPASGSVTAIAVMVRPAMMSGRYRALCSAEPKLAMCTEAISAWTSAVTATPPKVERPSSSASHHRGKRVEFAAAVFRRIADAEESQLAHLAQRLARHEVLILPRVRERLDLGVDETPDLPPQQLVLLAEIRRGERRYRLARDRLVHGLIRIVAAPARRPGRVLRAWRRRSRGASAPCRNWCTGQCARPARRAAPARSSRRRRPASRPDRSRRLSLLAARPSSRAGRTG